MGCRTSLVPLRLGGGETQMDALALIGKVTDSSRICLRFIYTPGRLALITSVI